MASKNEELRRLSLEIRVLEQNLEIAQIRIDRVNAVITDLTLARMSLEGVEPEKENAELFVPIGGSSYIRARLESSEKVVVGMGASVSIEKTLPEAKEIIKKRLESLEKTRLSLQQQFTQIADRITDDRSKFESMVASLRQEKTPSNV